MSPQATASRIRLSLTSFFSSSSRNVVVVGGESGIVKVTQVGSALPRYASDYWRAPDGRGPAPLRWCAPEVLCQVRCDATPRPSLGGGCATV